MKIEQRILDFEKAGFGLFVHFGIYSRLGKGEWAKDHFNMTWEEYLPLFDGFAPEHNWAEKLAEAAADAGCKYITLTARHHDGFSLFDTCGLNAYDSVHSCGRDLCREFVDACRNHGILPFFYHTLLDWHEKSYRTDFKAYLKYLRKSVELLCTNYGKIGGIWFDGMWEQPDADWEEDALYSLIRKHQPDAIIINNTGMDKRGALGHIELDSITFERGRPEPRNFEGAPKYIASEMCEIFADHWGYAENDLNYRSVAEIIETLAYCRRYGSNLLLNVGPMGDGNLRLIDRAMLELIGKWVKIHHTALYEPHPTDIVIENKPKDFILQNGDTYYLFVHDLKMMANINVAMRAVMDLDERFVFDKEITSVRWLDNGKPLEYSQENGKTLIHTEPFKYGENYVVRIAEIKV